MMVPQQHSRGFTLAEIVVCLALLTIAATIAMRVNGQGLAQLAQADTRLRMQDTAASIIETLRLHPAWFSQSETTTFDSTAYPELAIDDDMRLELAIRPVRCSDYVTLEPGLSDLPLYEVNLKLYATQAPASILSWQVLLKGENADESQPD